MRTDVSVMERADPMPHSLARLQTAASRRRRRGALRPRRAALDSSGGIADRRVSHHSPGEVLSMEKISSKLVGMTFEPAAFEWTRRTSCCTRSASAPSRQHDLDYVYENKGPRVLPTFAVIPGMLSMGGLVSNVEINLMMLLHGEQGITLHRELPPEAHVKVIGKVTAVWDKGKAAVIETEGLVQDDKGPLVTTTSTLFIRGAGGFGGERGPSTTGVNEPPDRKPDHVDQGSRAAGAGRDLSPVGRPQPDPHRSRLRQGGRLRGAVPARPLHLRHRRPRHPRQRVRRRSGALHVLLGPLRRSGLSTATTSSPRSGSRPRARRSCGPSRRRATRSCRRPRRRSRVAGTRLAAPRWRRAHVRRSAATLPRAQAQPSRHCCTAAISSSIVTVVLPSRSAAGHSETGTDSSEMLTARTSSLIATSPSPSQSPVHGGGVLVAVGTGDGRGGHARRIRRRRGWRRLCRRRGRRGQCRSPLAVAVSVAVGVAVAVRVALAVGVAVTVRRARRVSRSAVGSGASGSMSKHAVHRQDTGDQLAVLIAGRGRGRG